MMISKLPHSRVSGLRRRGPGHLELAAELCKLGLERGDLLPVPSLLLLQLLALLLHGRRHLLELLLLGEYLPRRPGQRLHLGLGLGNRAKHRIASANQHSIGTQEGEF